MIMSNNTVRPGYSRKVISAKAVPVEPSSIVSELTLQNSEYVIGTQDLAFWRDTDATLYATFQGERGPEVWFFHDVLRGWIPLDCEHPDPV